jgi:hypothetical protein
MYLNEYALHKIAEARLAELREDAKQRHLAAAREERVRRRSQRGETPGRWTLAYLLGR